MNVGLALEIDGSIDKMSGVITELESRLKECFRDKDFGSDVKNLFIVIILTGPQSEELHPIRALNYKKRVEIPLVNVVLEDVIEYDIKPSFDLFSQLTHVQARHYLAQLLVDSVPVLERNREKYPAFRVEEFKHALKQCLLGGSAPV